MLLCVPEPCTRFLHTTTCYYLASSSWTGVGRPSSSSARSVSPRSASPRGPKYRAAPNDAVDRAVGRVATDLGINPDEIKRVGPSKYRFFSDSKTVSTRSVGKKIVVRIGGKRSARCGCGRGRCSHIPFFQEAGKTFVSTCNNTEGKARVCCLLQPWLTSCLFSGSVQTKDIDA